MKAPKIDTSGTEMAQRAVAEAQQASVNLQKNFAADLGINNMADIVPGGTAAQQPGASTKRRRANGNTIASALGLDL
jgi:hypothetical protein